MNKKLALIVGVALLVVGLFTTAQDSKVMASWLIDQSGTLVQVDPMVLGESDTTNSHDSTEVEHTDASPTPSTSSEDHPSVVEPEHTTSATTTNTEALKARQEQEKKTLELKQEAAKKKLEQQTEARKKALELSKQVRKSTLENKDNKLEVKQTIEDHAGKTVKTTNVELPANESLHVEQKDGTAVEVKAIEGKALEIQGEKVRTRTNLPLSIGDNNTLIVTRKDGTQKVVAVLPDAAVANLQAKGFITTSTDTALEESDNGTPVYKFDTEQEKKVLGIFPRKFKQSVEVSAETGDVVNAQSQQSGILRILERFAF